MPINARHPVNQKVATYPITIIIKIGIVMNNPEFLFSPLTTKVADKIPPTVNRIPIMIISRSETRKKLFPFEFKATINATIAGSNAMTVLIMGLDIVL